MDVDSERRRLEQETLLREFTRPFKPDEMITVYLSEMVDRHNHGIYCALVPTADVDRILGLSVWDLQPGCGHPGTIVHLDNDDRKVAYLRFGNRNGIEPLVICRGFNKILPEYLELSEEFRLFHNLYHDRKKDQYIKIDSDGNEVIIATVKPDRVQVRLKEIQQFIAIREMHCAIFFDYAEFSSFSLAELGLELDGECTRKELACWQHNYGDGKGASYESFSYVRGKRLIPPLPKEKSGFWGFAEETPKQYAEFIIGMDGNGDEITHTCNPALLANFFGANPEAPNFLTSVSFRKEVLDKYYNASRYDVLDGLLRCGNLWCMSIDNHNEDRVCAWLGDLGEHMPYEEQLHWRSHNITSPDGISETYLRRQILAEPTESERPEHLFGQRYRELSSTCGQCLGWQILLPLSQDDVHLLGSIRVPAVDEQRDFDELVLALAKILIDSLNEKQLKVLLPDAASENIRGIALLECVLIERRVEGMEQHIGFLRKLQSLRSTGAAHRKGRKYEKAFAKFSAGDEDIRVAFSNILHQILCLLDFLLETVRSGKLGLSAPQ